MRNGVRFINMEAATAPAGAVLEPFGGYDDDGFLKVRKSTRDNATDVIFNGPGEVAAGAVGEGYPAHPIATAGIDSASLPLANRQTLGTAVGGWRLVTTKTGFVAIAQAYNGLVDVQPQLSAAGDGSVKVSPTLTRADNPIAIDDDKTAKVIRFGPDFYVDEGDAADDPKTVWAKLTKLIQFIDKVCITNPVFTAIKTDGVLTGIAIDGVEITEGGIDLDLKTLINPQKKTAKLPPSTEVKEVECGVFDEDCCPSTWWCTGPDGDPAWTVVEVVYGGAPPEGGYGPYATEEDANTACVDPDDPGEPVEVACCPDNPVPRTLTITEVGGGSFPLVYNATYGGTGAWLTYPPDDFPDYPGKISLAGGGGYARIALNGSGSCTITANLDGNICEGSSAVDPVITCSPFSMTFPLTFVVFGGGSCPCDGETRNFVITE